jgi:predicted TIM-barrel fold metal-dependent hydrolase
MSVWRSKLSRRVFVNGALGAGASVVLAMQDSQRSHAQPARRMIVDAQVHLWKAESPDWPWVPGLKPQLPEPMTIERLLPLMDEAGVDRVVVVPPSWPGDRNDYGIEAARRYPDRFHVMGRIPLKNPDSANLLPTWREQPGMLGVRLIFVGPTESWVKDGTADWFWPAAEKAQIPVMFFAPRQLALFGPIAERHPQLTLIIDHLGLRLGMTKEEIESGIEQAVALARYPNVSIKLSATPGVSNDAYPYRDVSGPLQRAFDAYGPQRCHWGTDLTNTFGKGTYHQRITHFTEELSFLSESDKDWVMGRAILARLRWT